jgi:hypothetical protein
MHRNNAIIAGAANNSRNEAHFFIISSCRKISFDIRTERSIDRIGD